MLRLPSELVQLGAGYLPIESYLALSSTCKRLRKLFTRQDVFLRYLGAQPVPSDRSIAHLMGRVARLLSTPSIEHHLQIDIASGVEDFFVDEVPAWQYEHRLIGTNGSIHIYITRMDGDEDGITHLVQGFFVRRWKIYHAMHQLSGDEGTFQCQFVGQNRVIVWGPKEADLYLFNGTAERLQVTQVEGECLAATQSGLFLQEYSHVQKLMVFATEGGVERDWGDIDPIYTSGKRFFFSSDRAILYQLLVTSTHTTMVTQYQHAEGQLDQDVPCGGELVTHQIHDERSATTIVRQEDQTYAIQWDLTHRSKPHFAAIEYEEEEEIETEPRVQLDAQTVRWMAPPYLRHNTEDWAGFANAIDDEPFREACLAESRRRVVIDAYKEAVQEDSRKGWERVLKQTGENQLISPILQEMIWSYDRESPSLDTLKSRIEHLPESVERTLLLEGVKTRLAALNPPKRLRRSYR